MKKTKDWLDIINLLDFVTLLGNQLWNNKAGHQIDQVCSQAVHTALKWFNESSNNTLKKNRLCFEMSLSMIPDCSKGHCFSTTKKTWLRFEMSLGEIQEHSSQMFCSKSWVRSDPLNWNIRWIMFFSPKHILYSFLKIMIEMSLSVIWVQLIYNYVVKIIDFHWIEISVMVVREQFNQCDTQSCLQKRWNPRCH